MLVKGATGNLVYSFRMNKVLLHDINILRPIQNGRHFPDDIFKCIFLNENVWISIKISLKFVPKGPINNIPALVQIMARCRPGDKPLSEPVMVSLLTHICVTRPQRVNIMYNISVYLLFWTNKGPLLCHLHNEVVGGESLVWVIMGRREVSKNAGILVVLVWNWEVKIEYLHKSYKTVHCLYIIQKDYVFMTIMFTCIWTQLFTYSDHFSMWGFAG